MSETCVGDNSTNDKLPVYRMEFIALRITMFIRLFRIKNSDWPLDCTKLIRKMKEAQTIPFTYGFFRLPDKYEAITEYHSDYNLYLMQINRNRVRYPFETSADRRLNFTLAHEIGHILLDHLKVPRNLKTKEEISKEEHEANEFAGQLLMPSNLLTSCNYRSINAVAAYLNVSNSALWMRLNKMYRLDLLQNKKGCVCNKCGNASMHYSAKYCCICGNKLKNNSNGVFSVSYHDGIEFSNNNYYSNTEMYSCDDYNDRDFCSLGHYNQTIVYNYCEKSEYRDKGNCIYLNPNNARYCEMCGSETYFYSIGLLKSWNEARKKFISGIVAEDDAEYCGFV